MRGQLPFLGLVFALGASPGLALAGAADDAGRFQSQAMDLRYRMQRSSNAQDMQALHQQIGKETAQATRDSFKQNMVNTFAAIQRRKEAEAKLIRERFAAIEASLGKGKGGKNPGGSAAQPTGSKAASSQSAPPAQRKSAPVVLDGKNIQREIEFGKPSQAK